MKTVTLEVELTLSQLSLFKLLISTIKHNITMSKIVCNNSIVKYTQLLSLDTSVIKWNVGQEKLQKYLINHCESESRLQYVVFEVMSIQY